MNECSTTQRRYKVPKGSPSEKENGTCGKGCFCLDNYVDVESANKINKIKGIVPTSFCDGHESSAYGHNKGQSLLVFRPTTINRNDLKKGIKSLCNSSNVTILNHDDRYFVTDNEGTALRSKELPCKNRIIKYRKATKEEMQKYKTMDPEYFALNKKPHTNVQIVSKGRNSKAWWEAVANTLTSIEKSSNKRNKNLF